MRDTKCRALINIYHRPTAQVVADRLDYAIDVSCRTLHSRGGEGQVWPRLVPVVLRFGNAEVGPHRLALPVTASTEARAEMATGRVPVRAQLARLRLVSAAKVEKAAGMGPVRSVQPLKVSTVSLVNNDKAAGIEPTILALVSKVKVLSWFKVE